MAKVRIVDIAKKTGFSTATISNVLNHRHGVGSANREIILQAASEMGYTGKANRSPNCRNIVRLVIFRKHGLVIGDTQFFSELIEGIELGCRMADVELVISKIDYSKRAESLSTIHMICNEECRGVLLLGTEMETEELHLFENCCSPYLVVDNLFRHENVHSIVMNNYNAGFMATEWLIEAGHRNVAHITSSVEFNNMRYRRKGYEAAMQTHDIPLPANAIWRVTPTIEGAYQDMKRHIQQGRPLPTAFFAGNDIIAVGCMRALQEHGEKIPQSLSLIGMDDTVICQITNPPLSTIHVYRKEMGISAVNSLLYVIPQASQGKMKIELGVTRTDRQSIAPPRI